MKKIVWVCVVVIMLVGLAGYSAASGVDAALDNAKKEGRAVMLELGSEGCVPCEQMKPVLEKLREAYKGRLEVIFVDIRKDREAAHEFRVFAIPTQVFLDKNGKEFHRHMGFYDYEEILPVLKEAGI